MANTPAFKLNIAGGSGGKGGSSLCCNGGSGGDGGGFGFPTILGTAILTTTQTGSPGFLAIVANGSGGSGGNSGACCKGGNGGTEPVPNLQGGLIVRTDRTRMDHHDAGRILAGFPGHQPRGGWRRGRHRGKRRVSRRQRRTCKRDFHRFESKFPLPVLLNATTSGAQSPGISLALSPMDGARAGNGGQGGTNDAANGGNGGAGGTPFASDLGLENSIIKTTGDTSPAIVALSQGGTGGAGGTSALAGRRRYRRVRAAAAARSMSISLARTCSPPLAKTLTGSRPTVWAAMAE